VRNRENDLKYRDKRIRDGTSYAERWRVREKNRGNAKSLEGSLIRMRHPVSRISR
jgi:hypothetical protein